MKVQKVEISNFRNLRSFALDLNGESLTLVGENAAGKSSVMLAIARALGRDRGTTLQDFADPGLPIEVIVTLSGFRREDQKLFPKELAFTASATSLRVGFRAIWDAQEQEVDAFCGFPDRAWARLLKAQRDGLPVLWLSPSRDPARLLQLATSRSFLPRIFSDRSLDTVVATATQGVTAALNGLTHNERMTALFLELTQQLSKFTPGVDSEAFDLGLRSTTKDSDLLNEFELLLSYGGPGVPVTRQSDGLAQLAVFTCLLRLLTNDPRTLVLVDEPELSLHPHSQRALSAALRKLPNQLLLATHSSSILDRADLRDVIRLETTALGTTPHRATSLTEAEATRLARFVNPLTAEACFARKLVLVEGYSDRVILMELAARLGRDLDAEGISVVSLDGGAAIGTFLRLFGPPGLNLKVLGLCDEDKESFWISEIRKVDPTVVDSTSLEKAGYFVCVKNLEEEFVRALGVLETTNMIQEEGMQGPFALFCQQPSQSGIAAEEVLRRYLHNENTRWAVPLVAKLRLDNIPKALDDLLQRL